MIKSSMSVVTIRKQKRHQPKYPSKKALVAQFLCKNRNLDEADSDSNRALDPNTEHHQGNFLVSPLRPLLSNTLIIRFVDELEASK